MREVNLVPGGENGRPQDACLLALSDGVGCHESRSGVGISAVVRCFHEPACYVIKGTPVTHSIPEDLFQVCFLLSGLASSSKVRGVTTDERLASFVGEVNLGLFMFGWEKTASGVLDLRSRRGDQFQPVKPERVAGGDPVVCFEG